MATDRHLDAPYLRAESVQERATERPRPRTVQGAPGWIWLPSSVALGLLAWELIVRAGNYPSYILPRPWEVAARFASAFADGTWWRHTQVTLVESLLGLARWRPLERALSPYVAASQSLPVIAIAPLLILWFGYGLFPKVLVCALVVFFPILVNTLVGIRNIPKDLLEVAQVYGANWWQRLRMVELPLALPVLLGGVRLGMTLSITGAVVAEFVGADVGLGVLLNVSKGLFDTPLMFVALITLVVMAAGFYAVATALDRILLSWQER